MNDKSILVAAAGTGGHIFPGIAVADALRKREFNVHWLGTPNGLEQKIVPKHNFPLHELNVEGIRGRGLRGLIIAPIKVVVSVIQSVRLLRALKVEIVIGFGGYVCGPIGIAARLTGKQLVLHEQNAISGTTNKLLAKFAHKCFSAFPNALKDATWVGNPIRDELIFNESPSERIRSDNLPARILVLGGSRGAKAINELVPKALGLLGIDNIEVTHQTGKSKLKETLEHYAELPLKKNVVEFIDDMRAAFMNADLVICRAGASTVSELCATGVGAILIPFPYAIDDHQTENARFLENNEAGVILQERQTDAETLAQCMKTLLLSKGKLQAMAENAYRLRKITAASDIADYCESTVNV